MDRLMDEEAAQEEADMKVIVMKRRLEALKKKREAAKAVKVRSQKGLE
jgi:zinc finger protein 830